MPPPGSGQSVKLFVGGLPHDLKDDDFRQHFGAYGELSDCTIMRDSLTGTSRGFGFLVFESGNCAQQCLGSGPHELCGKVVDVKLAVPRERMGAPQPGPGVAGRPMGGMMGGGRGGFPAPRAAAGDGGKVFVGGLAHEVMQSDLVEFFSQFGEVSSTMLMTDRVTGKSRGFGFVTFADASSAQSVLQIKNHSIKGKMAEVKPAVPRGSEGAAAPMGMGGMGGMGGMMVGGGAPSMGGGGNYGGYQQQAPGYGLGGGSLYSAYPQAPAQQPPQGGYAGHAPTQQAQTLQQAQPPQQQYQGYGQQPVQSMQPQQASSGYAQSSGVTSQQTTYMSQQPQQQPQQQAVAPQQQQPQQYSTYPQPAQEQQPAASVGGGQYGAIAPNQPQQQPQQQQQQPYTGYTGLPQTTEPAGYSGYMPQQQPQQQSHQSQQQPQVQSYGVGYDVSGGLGMPAATGHSGQMSNRYTPY